jgi:riboflavin synthase
MFTGLVQAMGRIAARREEGRVLELELESAEIAPELTVGASVAVSGVCLTAVDISGERFRVELAEETLARTRLGRIAIGGGVNLELPLRPSDPLGGHFVQGHVDEVGRLAEAGLRGENWVLRVEHRAESSLLVVEKGSIAIDGVSLTVTACGPGWLEVMLIPHTLEVTTLGSASAGDEVHLEYDILAKYVARLAAPYLGTPSGR